MGVTTCYFEEKGDDDNVEEQAGSNLHRGSHNFGDPSGKTYGAATGTNFSLGFTADLYSKNHHCW
jgi:hypothetical protein